MKNKVVLLVLFAMAISQVAFASAATDKLKRGGEGIFTAPLEHCNEYLNTRAEYGVPQSIAAAIFQGAFYTGKRLINGIYDVLTFPLNCPKEHGLLFADAYPTALDEHRALKNKSGVK